MGSHFLFFLMQLGDSCTNLENSITSLLQIFTLIEKRDLRVQEGMKLLSIGSESPYTVFTKIDVKDQQLRKNPEIDKDCYDF